MSNVRKLERRRNKRRAARDVLGAAPDGTVINLEDRPGTCAIDLGIIAQAARGVCEPHGLLALVIVYDPKLRCFNVDFRGSDPDIAALILRRAEINLLTKVLK